MPGLSKVIVLDPDARTGRQIQLGFEREGVPVTTLAPEPAPLDRLGDLLGEDTGLVVIGGGVDGRGLERVRQVRAALDGRRIDAAIMFAGCGAGRDELAAAGADEVVLQPAYLRDVVTIGRLLRGVPATHRGHLVGTLTEISGVFTLVRAFAALGRSATLTLIRGLRRGEIRFWHGEVTSAQVGMIHGQAALHQLLLWTDARFDFHHEDVVRRQQIPLTHDELFADAERFLEGVRDSSGGLSPSIVLEQDLPRVQSFGKQIPTEVYGVLRMFDGHRVLADVLEDSAYRVFETLRVAQRAVEIGLLRVIDKPPVRPSWRAILSIEEWLIGSEARDAAIDSGPIAAASAGGKSKSRKKRRKKKRLETPIAVPLGAAAKEIDWGALVPRIVGAEVGPLAGVVPSAQASGEIAPRADSPRDRTVHPGGEPKVVFDEAAERARNAAEIAARAEAIRAEAARVEAEAKARRDAEAKAQRDAEQAKQAAEAEAQKQAAEAEAAKQAAEAEAAKQAAEAEAAKQAAEAKKQEAAKQAAEAEAAKQAAEAEAKKQEAAKKAAEAEAAKQAAEAEVAKQAAAVEAAQRAAEAEAAKQAAAAEAAKQAAEAEAAQQAAEAKAAQQAAEAEAAAVAKQAADTAAAAESAAAAAAESAAAAAAESAAAAAAESAAAAAAAAESAPAAAPTAAAESKPAQLATDPMTTSPEGRVASDLPSDDTKPERVANRTTLQGLAVVADTRADDAVASPVVDVSGAVTTRTTAPGVAVADLSGAITARTAVPEAAVAAASHGTTTKISVPPPPALAPALASTPGVIVDEPSDGVIVQHITTAKTAPVKRRRLPSDPPEDDRPEDAMGEITSPGPRATAEPRHSEPSILVADLGVIHSAVSAIAVDQAAAPATADATSAAHEAPVVAARSDVAAFSEVEEAFFRAGHEKEAAVAAPPVVESFDDLDEGYRPVGFWDRLRGRSARKARLAAKALATTQPGKAPAPAVPAKPPAPAAPPAPVPAAAAKPSTPPTPAAAPQPSAKSPSTANRPPGKPSPKSSGKRKKR